MNFVDWIKIVIMLKIVKEPIKQLSDTTMHIFPQAFNSLIVDGAPHNNTTSINSTVLKHMSCYQCVFSSLVTPESRWKGIMLNGIKEKTVHSICTIVVAAPNVHHHSAEAINTSMSDKPPPDQFMVPI